MNLSFLFFCFITVSLMGGLKTDTVAEAAFLYNPENGSILFEKNGHQAHYPASTTKLVTALVAVEKAYARTKDPLQVRISATQESVGSVTEEAKKRSNYTLPSWWLVPGASHIGIKRGEELSFNDLMHGMLLSSGDDASNVIGEYISGSIPAFVEEMNGYVARLGLNETRFTNPHGLFHPEQKTSAHDLAKIMAEVIKNPLLMEILGRSSYTRPKTNKQEATPMVQTNRLMRPGPYFYSKALGGKTGHLALAQNTFVTAARDGDRTLVLVLLKVKERADLWKESVRLFEMAFNEPKVEKTLLSKGKQKNVLVLPDFSSPIEVEMKEDLAYSFFPAEEPKVRATIHWQPLKPSVSSGQKVGEVRVSDGNGKILATKELYSIRTVGPTLGYRFKDLLRSMTTPSGLGISLLLLGGIGALFFIFTARRLRH